jgi:nicotinate-nucleotide pyrophosphorylase (carboxylating)
VKSSLDPAVVRRLVESALHEDLDEAGDVTTDAVVPAGGRAAGHIVARSRLILSGIGVAREVFRNLDGSLEFLQKETDGTDVPAGRRVATVVGDPRPILIGERTALNFLTRMCGIATVTRRAVEEIAGSGARILDTRKTAPGLRSIDKYAVACGGATNHRMGLYDAVMIKDTHLGSGCTIDRGVRRALDRGHSRDRITVEVRNRDQLEQAIASGAGRALLDNMSVDELRQAVEFAAGRIVLEASGGLRPGGLRAVAETGVDFLSLGWLTHSAPASDLAMELEELA